MERKRKARRKAIIRAYVARAIVALILITMLILMFCGCLYIRDLFKKDNTAQTDISDEALEEKPELEVSQEDTDSEEEQQQEAEEIIYTQYPGVSIVLDPGHGGNDGGTTSKDASIIEKDINLAVSLEIAALLEKHGVTVLLTRDSDTFMSLDERVYFSNQKSADLFVSIHCNFYEGDDSIDGLETFYCRNDEASRVFAESIVNAVSQVPEIALRGATENNHYVTRHAGTKATLIEMGFLSNPEECSKLNTAEYQKLLAETIVKGILDAFASEAVS